jgi:2,4-dienoyl-CoA reductase-like NADH-dependent reductase (Old Yellow Enzyme family)
MSEDPLLQPYQLKHLTLRNRIMTTSHEPAYPEDGCQRIATACITLNGPRPALR